MPGIRRIGRSHRVRYVDASGQTVAERDTLQRIRALVIPPAWTNVWICPHPLGHLQATGRDARGRKQYRYHARWREVRDEVKYGRLLAFARILPRIRERTTADLGRPGLPREKVVATVVQLLEKTLIRVGNDEYARENRSFGLTTLEERHATVYGSTVRFEFRGKSGVSHSVDLSDRRIARIVKACRDLPGHELFQYVDGEGARQAIDSADVNAYLRDVSGEDFTAKDFRTWAGTVIVAKELAQTSRKEAPASKTAVKRTILRAIETAADRLGNTVSVCRKCYIHPAILTCYEDGRIIRPRKSATGGAHDLLPDEAAVVALLSQSVGSGFSRSRKNPAKPHSTRSRASVRSRRA